MPRKGLHTSLLIAAALCVSSLPFLLVGELPGGRRLSGPPGWIAWLALHLVMLVGFRNRLNVLTNWAWNYLTYDRASRIVIDPPGEVLRNRGEERRR